VKNDATPFPVFWSFSAAAARRGKYAAQLTVQDSRGDPARIEKVCKPVVDREFSEGYVDPGFP
jgi:hypothetical protein